jgi:hypothetical protein
MHGQQALLEGPCSPAACYCCACAWTDPLLPQGSAACWGYWKPATVPRVAAAPWLRNSWAQLVTLAYIEPGHAKLAITASLLWGSCWRCWGSNQHGAHGTLAGVPVSSHSPYWLLKPCWLCHTSTCEKRQALSDLGRLGTAWPLSPTCNTMLLKLQATHALLPHCTRADTNVVLHEALEADRYYWGDNHTDFWGTVVQVAEPVQIAVLNMPWKWCTILRRQHI